MKRLVRNRTVRADLPTLSLPTIATLRARLRSSLLCLLLMPFSGLLLLWEEEGEVLWLLLGWVDRLRSPLISFITQRGTQDTPRSWPVISGSRGSQEQRLSLQRHSTRNSWSSFIWILLFDFSRALCYSKLSVRTRPVAMAGHRDGYPHTLTARVTLRYWPRPLPFLYPQPLRQFPWKSLPRCHMSLFSRKTRKHNRILRTKRIVCVLQSLQFQ